MASRNDINLLDWYLLLCRPVSGRRGISRRGKTGLGLRGGVRGTAGDMVEVAADVALDRRGGRTRAIGQRCRLASLWGWPARGVETGAWSSLTLVVVLILSSSVGVALDRSVGFTLTAM